MSRFGFRKRLPSRRDALAGGLGAAALALAPRLPRAAPGEAGGLATRPIPQGGEPLPVVGLGTAINFDAGEDAKKRADLKGVVEGLVEGGGKLIDTAGSYGTAESVVGDLLGPELRPRVFLATKVRSPDMTEFRRSLDRLRADKVDLIQLHNVRDPNQKLDALREWKAQRLCRYIGITTTSERDYAAAEAILRREKPDFLQIDYSLGDRDAEARLIPAAAEGGAGVITALPFGRNSLFRAVRGKPLPDWAAEFEAATWAQFFLKFILGNEAVTVAIPGTNKREHMLDNLGAARGRLPDVAERKKMVAFFDAL